VNPCPRFLQHDAPGADIEWPIRPTSFEDKGERLQADAYVGFGTVPTFANALVELTAAVRSCTERGMRVVVTAPARICEANYFLSTVTWSRHGTS
jgi:hypothetical protein